MHACIYVNFFNKFYKKKKTNQSLILFKRLNYWQGRIYIKLIASHNPKALFEIIISTEQKSA